MTSIEELEEKLREHKEEINYPAMRFRGNEIQIYNGGYVNLFIEESEHLGWNIEGNLHTDNETPDVNKEFHNTGELIEWLKEQFNN